VKAPALGSEDVHRKRKHSVQELNLFEVPAIPADIKAVMIAGPQYDLSDRETKMLRDFWNKDGRILVLARSRGQDAEAARLPQRARREGG
jgi:hypothetical protein